MKKNRGPNTSLTKFPQPWKISPTLSIHENIDTPEKISNENREHKPWLHHQQLLSTRTSIGTLPTAYFIYTLVQDPVFIKKLSGCSTFSCKNEQIFEEITVHFLTALKKLLFWATLKSASKHSKSTCYAYLLFLRFPSPILFWSFFALRWKHVVVVLNLFNVWVFSLVLQNFFFILNFFVYIRSVPFGTFFALQGDIWSEWLVCLTKQFFQWMRIEIHQSQVTSL